MTNNELSNIIEFYGIELYLINEIYGGVLIEFIKPKWYQFKIKKNLSNCKLRINSCKPVGVKFVYSWI